jgi:ABC-type lipoprotein export system ATPase subunit
VFVNLATGATLPEEGTVRVFGRATSEIADSADWLATVDRFGIVSERVVLLEQFTPLQNIAMSLTLDVEPFPADVRQRAEQLAREAGVDGDAFDRPVGGVGVGAAIASAWRARWRPRRRSADRASRGRSRAA